MPKLQVCVAMLTAPDQGFPCEMLPPVVPSEDPCTSELEGDTHHPKGHAGMHISQSLPKENIPE